MLLREGAERTKPLAMGSCVMNAPSVGRFHGRLRTLVTPTCADSASPGLAAASGRRPYRTEAIPNARGFRVFPSAERPSEHRHPRSSRCQPAAFLGCRLFQLNSNALDL